MEDTELFNKNYIRQTSKYFDSIVSIMSETEGKKKESGDKEKREVKKRKT